MLMNDELDEYYRVVNNTRTLIWNVEDLENPINTGIFYSAKEAIDHNLYIRSVSKSKGAGLSSRNSFSNHNL